MHDNIQFLFDFWANLFVQLIVLNRVFQKIPAKKKRTAVLP